MGKTERQSESAIQFAKGYAKAYPPYIEYTLEPKGTTIIAQSNEKFRSSREELFTDYLTSNGKRKEATQGLFAEQIVRLALQPTLEETGFQIALAPQSLEHGNDQKGVDLLISDSNNMPYLGIDVKLHHGRSSRKRDGHGWSENLLSPHIYLSLGDWTSTVNGNSNISMKKWLKTVAIPRINDARPIPEIKSLRSFLVERIERSLNGYHDKLLDPEDFFDNSVIPEDKNEREILTEKLGVMHSLFTDLRISLPPYQKYDFSSSEQNIKSNPSEEIIFSLAADDD